MRETFSTKIPSPIHCSKLKLQCRVNAVDVDSSEGPKGAVPYSYLVDRYGRMLPVRTSAAAVPIVRLRGGALIYGIIGHNNHNTVPA